MANYSQNPPTIEEMQEILFVVRSLEKMANFTGHLPLRKAIANAKYILQDAIERVAA